MALAAAASAHAQATAGNLLQGLKPTRHQGVLNPARLTDGTAAKDGSFWDTELTSRFPHLQEVFRSGSGTWHWSSADDRYVAAT